MALPRYIKRSYSGGAEALTLTENITSSSTSYGVTGNFSNWPSGATGKFCIAVDRGLTSLEKMEMSAFTQSTGVMTVFVTGSSTGRGFDGTIATTHVPSTEVPQVQLVWTATESTEANWAVVNTVAKIQSAGDLLVGTAANTMGRVPAGTNGYLLQSTGSGVQWVNPATEFSLNTTLAAIKGVAATHAVGTATTAARADHEHPWRAVTYIGIPLHGSAPSGTANWYVQVARAVARTNSSGQAAVTLSRAYGTCLQAATVQPCETAAQNATVTIDPADCSLIRVSFKVLAGGSPVATTTMGFMVWAIGAA